MRKPDLVIGDPPQTLRWNLFRWRGIQVALHRWVRSDNDRALHDHSAGNISILLTGCYRERFNHKWQPLRSKLRLPFIPYYRGGATPHRVELTHGPLWTLWIRFKPWREWGFWCDRKRWVHWEDFVDNSGGYKGSNNKMTGVQSNVGRGCG